MSDTTCKRCGTSIRWNGQKWTSADSPVESCLPGLGSDHQPEEETCTATPPGYPNWSCRQPAGHEGEHTRGPLHWTEEKA